MVTAFPVPENERKAEALHRMIVNYGHIDRDRVLSVPLEARRTDLPSSYDVADADLEDGDDDEDDAAAGSLT